jgi:tetratricopeptide (TPR) repeat protein
MNRFFIIMMSLLAVVMVACHSDDVRERLDAIKTVGDREPERAMKMIDAIRPEVERASEHTRMRCLLLDMRLRDKADRMPASDDSARKIVAYFDNHGTASERQEAHYYAGSAYRDLQDTPNALLHFMKSEDIAHEGDGCDSLMLRNTYSNLHFLFYNVQDYQNACLYAERECDMTERLGLDPLRSLTHLGATLAALDSLDRSHRVYLKALALVEADTTQHYEAELLYSLLMNFAYLKDEVNARKCASMVEPLNQGDNTDMKCFAFAEYYRMTGRMDSAIVCYQQILRNQTDLFFMYDAAKALFHIYHERGDALMASQWAARYIAVSDSIDLGHRQEMAATVNNQYQYYRNVEEEARIKDENTRYHQQLWGVDTMAVVVILGMALYLIWRLNRHLKELIQLSDELKVSRSNAEEMKAKLATHKAQLADSEMSLQTTKDKLARVNGEIDRYKQELRDKEQLLEEKLDENKRFVRLLHKADLEESAEDVVAAIRKASVGRHKMTSADWQRIFAAVDELQPDLMERLVHHVGKFTEQQQQVCYLLSIGLTNTQIENLTDIPHVTVWRWAKKMEWALGSR